jgi:hypothetical protein
MFQQPYIVTRINLNYLLFVIIPILLVPKVHLSLWIQRFLVSAGIVAKAVFAGVEGMS